MKIFDFSDGVKGEYLGNVESWRGNTGWRNEELGIKDKVMIGPYSYTRKFSAYSGGKTQDFVAEDFGVDAVCFCIGQTSHDGKWHWHFTANDEWMRELLSERKIVEGRSYE